jgi:hypothetical protein
MVVLKLSEDVDVYDVFPLEAKDIPQRLKKYVVRCPRFMSKSNEGRDENVGSSPETIR